MFDKTKKNLYHKADGENKNRHTKTIKAQKATSWQQNNRPDKNNNRLYPVARLRLVLFP